MRFAAVLLVAFACSVAFAEECPDLRTYKLGTPIQQIISADPKHKFKVVSKRNDLYRREHIKKDSQVTIYNRTVTWDDFTEVRLVTDSPDGVVVEIVTTVKGNPDAAYNALVTKFGAPQTGAYEPNIDGGDHVSEPNIDAFWTLPCGANVVFHGVGETKYDVPYSTVRYTAKGFRKDILD